MTHVKDVDLDFTFDHLWEWVASKPEDKVIHSYPYSCHCTIVNFLKDHLGERKVQASFAYAWTQQDKFSDVVQYVLPAWSRGIIGALDDLCGMRKNDQLTAGEVLDYLDNVDREEFV